MQALKAIEVRRVGSSADLVQPGDYTYIAKREPRRRIEEVEITAPKNFFKRLLWNFRGPKVEHKQIVEILWPDYNAVILNCPNCNGPIATTSAHKILNIEPLTISIPLACAYEKTQGVSAESRGKESAPSFRITEGKIQLT